MQVNGINMLCEGLTFVEIGENIQRASPNPNGVGLRVILTKDEENVFYSMAGIFVGRFLAEIICDAIKAKGVEPGFGYVYSNLVFTTHSVEPETPA
jgi:hypothetical protein